jgi:prolyl oligopeptidase
LRLETKAGHGQGKPRGKLLDELTDTWSFVFWQLGLDPKKPSVASTDSSEKKG